MLPAQWWFELAWTPQSRFQLRIRSESLNSSERTKKTILYQNITDWSSILWIHGGPTIAHRCHFYFSSYLEFERFWYISDDITSRNHVMEQSQLIFSDQIINLAQTGTDTANILFTYQLDLQFDNCLSKLNGRKDQKFQWIQIVPWVPPANSLSLGNFLPNIFEGCIVFHRRRACCCDVCMTGDFFACERLKSLDRRFQNRIYFIFETRFWMFWLQKSTTNGQKWTLNMIWSTKTGWKRGKSTF